VGFFNDLFGFDLFGEDQWPRYEMEHRRRPIVTEDHKGLPVHGYVPQSDAKVALVNEFKQDEERLLRKIDRMQGIVDDPMSIAVAEQFAYDQRWLAIARTGFEQAFMALNRAVFRPQRIKLPEDDGNPPGRQTSPEIASLAGRLMDHADPDVRKLAASALGQVNE